MSWRSVENSYHPGPMASGLARWSVFRITGLVALWMVASCVAFVTRWYRIARWRANADAGSGGMDLVVDPHLPSPLSLTLLLLVLLGPPAWLVTVWRRARASAAK